MNDVLTVISILLSVVVAAVLIWLIIEHKKLMRQIALLGSGMERNNKDLAGLCSAAVIIDKRLSASNNQLTESVEKTSTPETKGQQDKQPYHNAIQLVREGANSEDLMQLSGLSRDEADLLIRLHRNGV